MFSKFFSFDSFITPSIIVIIFWIGVVVNVIAGVVMLFSGGGFGGVIGGLLIIVLGPIFTKIWCELVMILFKVHEVLTEIRDKS